MLAFETVENYENRLLPFKFEEQPCSKCLFFSPGNHERQTSEDLGLWISDSVGAGQSHQQRHAHPSGRVRKSWLIKMLIFVVTFKCIFIASLFLQRLSAHAQYQQLQSDQWSPQAPCQRAASNTAPLHPNAGRTGTPLTPVPPHTQDVWQGTRTGEGKKLSCGKNSY